MLFNEHNSKRLFAEAGIPVPQGVAYTPETLHDALPPFPLPWFVKAQVLAGGRGKAGGIRRVDRAEDFVPTAQDILSMTIKGHTVPLVRVEPAADIAREFYISLSVSRERRRILLTVGREGGVEIENLGAENLMVQEIALPAGLQPHQIRAALFHMGLGKEHAAAFGQLVTKLFEASLKNGLLLAEINPLVLTGSGGFVALDGKVEADDNHVDLHPEMETYYQREHAGEEENLARDAGLSFVKLPGFVGLMVNGAGLAMATMDLLNFSGLTASNFLDLGGAADQQRMETALSLLFADGHVRVIFINLYGGILSCRKVAQALTAALGGKDPEKPIVVRMSGNEAEDGLNLLRELDCEGVYLCSSMEEAISTLQSIRPQDAPIIEFPRSASAGVARRPMQPSLPSEARFGLGRGARVLVQGITGREGQLHTRLMQEYGTHVVAGVTPFKGGQSVLGVPVFDSIAEARKRHEIDASIIFVPPRLAPDAILEAVANEIPWVVCITEGIPQHDMLSVMEQIRDSRTRLVGPNTPGIIVPGQTKIGILPATPFSPGPVAVLSRSGTLTYEVADRLTRAGIGQSLSVGIGGDPFIGTNFVDMFEMLRNHDETRAVVVLGEIGGRAEELLADYVVETGFSKPVVSFIAGRTAPEGKRLGHAGAILEKGRGIEGKLDAMRAAGFSVCDDLSQVAAAVAEVL